MCSVRLRHQHDRAVSGVQGGTNARRKAGDNRCVVRTEENLVTTWAGKVGVSKRHTAAHESLAAEYGVDRGQQIGPGTLLVNVTKAAETEPVSDDVRRRLLAHEDKFRVRREPADPCSGLESMQLRQIDIEQNQIRL